MLCRSCSVTLADGSRYCSACGSDQTDPGTPAIATIAPIATIVSPRLDAAALQELVMRTLANQYVVRRLLGAGGMASVFLADDLALERTVAIKVLPTEMAHDERVVARFQREAKTAAKLDHPHIIPIYRVESEGLLNYFVMKYVQGRSLDEVMRADEGLDVAFAQRVLQEAASALSHAHRRGVVHRDVKPANIMLDADDRVVLTDFGISKAGEGTSQLTQTGIIMGTPAYMAPEQVLGREVDGRADQYALAVLGYQMLTGKLPFDSDNTHALLYQQVHEAPPRASAVRPDLAAHIDDALVRAMAKDPGVRFPSADEFADALCGTPGASARRPVTADQPRVRTGDVATAPIPRRSAEAAATAATVAMRHRVSVTAARAAKSHRDRIRWLVGGVAAVLLVSTWAALTTHRSHEVKAATRLRDSIASASSDPIDSVHTNGDSGTAPASPATTAAAPAAADSTASGTGPAAAPVPAPATAVHLARRTPAAAVTATEDVRVTAPLTVNSDPYGTLYVDGVEVGVTPQASYPLAIGRSYDIRVERDGYKTKFETIIVTGPNEIRKRYVLEPVVAP